jgi:hypothetical protein
MAGGLGRNARLTSAVLLAAVLLVFGAGMARAQSDWTSEAPELDLSAVDVDALAEALATAIAEDIRREWDVSCGADNFNIYDTDVVHSIQLTVSNKGDCPFTVKVTKSGVAAPEDFVVPAGTPTTINRGNVTKITIDCGAPATGKCKASYTLTEVN